MYSTLVPAHTQRGRESETLAGVLTVLAIEARAVDFVERIRLALFREMHFYYRRKLPSLCTRFMRLFGPWPNFHYWS
jgi:hypothetical protein